MDGWGKCTKPRGAPLDRKRTLADSVPSIGTAAASAPAQLPGSGADTSIRVSARARVQSESSYSPAKRQRAERPDNVLAASSDCAVHAPSSPAVDSAAQLAVAEPLALAVCEDGRPEELHEPTPANKPSAPPRPTRRAAAQPQPSSRDSHPPPPVPAPKPASGLALDPALAPALEPLGRGMRSAAAARKGSFGRDGGRQNGQDDEAKQPLCARRDGAPQPQRVQREAHASRPHGPQQRAQQQAQSSKAAAAAPQPADEESEEGDLNDAFCAICLVAFSLDFTPEEQAAEEARVRGAAAASAAAVSRLEDSGAMEGVWVGGEAGEDAQPARRLFVNLETEALPTPAPPPPPPPALPPAAAAAAEGAAAGGGAAAATFAAAPLPCGPFAIDTRPNLVCDGACLRSFHVHCLERHGRALGLLSETVAIAVPGTPGEWRCAECAPGGAPRCFGCKAQLSADELNADHAAVTRRLGLCAPKRGRAGKGARAAGGGGGGGGGANGSAAVALAPSALRCAELGCGKAYCRACLASYPRAQWRSVLRVKCPLHLCAACGLGPTDTQCAACPAGFCVACVPDGSLHLSDDVCLCPAHTGVPGAGARAPALSGAAGALPTCGSVAGVALGPGGAAAAAAAEAAAAAAGGAGGADGGAARPWSLPLPPPHATVRLPPSHVRALHEIVAREEAAERRAKALESDDESEGEGREGGAARARRLAAVEAKAAALRTLALHRPGLFDPLRAGARDEAREAVRGVLAAMVAAVAVEVGADLSPASAAAAGAAAAGAAAAGAAAAGADAAGAAELGAVEPGAAEPVSAGMVAGVAMEREADDGGCAPLGDDLLARYIAESGCAAEAEARAATVASASGASEGCGSSIGSGSGSGSWRDFSPSPELDTAALLPMAQRERRLEASLARALSRVKSLNLLPPPRAFPSAWSGPFCLPPEWAEDELAELRARRAPSALGRGSGRPAKEPKPPRYHKLRANLYRIDRRAMMRDGLTSEQCQCVPPPAVAATASLSTHFGRGAGLASMAPPSEAASAAAGGNGCGSTAVTGVEAGAPAAAADAQPLARGAVVALVLCQPCGEGTAEESPTPAGAAIAGGPVAVVAAVPAVVDGDVAAAQSAPAGAGEVSAGAAPLQAEAAGTMAVVETAQQEATLSAALGAAQSELAAAPLLSQQQQWQAVLRGPNARRGDAASSLASAHQAKRLAGRAVGCAEGCINRAIFVECDPRNCPSGERCANLPFSGRKAAGANAGGACFEPFLTQDGKGWGLRATTPIAPGSFVIEYIGEVIDDEECRRRLRRMQQAAQRAAARATAGEGGAGGVRAAEGSGGGAGQTQAKAAAIGSRPAGRRGASAAAGARARDGKEEDADDEGGARRSRGRVSRITRRSSRKPARVSSSDAGSSEESDSPSSDSGSDSGGSDDDDDGSDGDSDDEARARACEGHFFIMEVGPNVVIDASRRGNAARFLNHSCDPNCEAQKWSVKGETRIGLFAQKPIAAGEEITFDYHFERFGQPIPCRCGSANCCGFLGNRPSKLAPASATGAAGKAAGARAAGAAGKRARGGGGGGEHELSHSARMQLLTSSWFSQAVRIIAGDEESGGREDAAGTARASACAEAEAGEPAASAAPMSEAMLQPALRAAHAAAPAPPSHAQAKGARVLLWRNKARALPARRAVWEGRAPVRRAPRFVRSVSAEERKSAQDVGGEMTAGSTGGADGGADDHTSDVSAIPGDCGGGAAAPPPTPLALEQARARRRRARVERAFRRTFDFGALGIGGNGGGAQALAAVAGDGAARPSAESRAPLGADNGHCELH